MPSSASVAKPRHRRRGGDAEHGEIDAPYSVSASGREREDAKIAQFTAEAITASWFPAQIHVLMNFGSGPPRASPCAMSRSSALPMTRASGDFRIRIGSASWIAMDAPPEREDSAPFVKSRAPHARSRRARARSDRTGSRRGYLLLLRFGHHDLSQGARRGDADALFADALTRREMAARRARRTCLPPYDEALLRRELELFPEWYLARHLDLELDPAQRESLEKRFTRLVRASLSQPKVYVHRDTCRATSC